MNNVQMAAWHLGTAWWHARYTCVVIDNMLLTVGVGAAPTLGTFLLRTKTADTQVDLYVRLDHTEEVLLVIVAATGGAEASSA